MFRLFLSFSVALMMASIFVPVAGGQMAGTRGGVEREVADVTGLPTLDPKVAEGYITIDGRAEVRVRPTDVRMVLAVTSEAETSQKCQQSIDATIDRLKGAWSKMGIGNERIVVDFIAVLPRYQWTPEKHGNIDVEVEKKVGYRMQTNVHLAAKGEAEARSALGRALEQGVTDIIAFDYWSKDLDETKVKVRQQALQAARDKADVLLGALFAQRPPAINVQERTTVRYPESLYHSVVNVADDAAGGYTGYRREVPFVKAYRPRNTYYRGLYVDSDVQPRELPMNPEISVVSTVRLYFKPVAPTATRPLRPASTVGPVPTTAAPPPAMRRP
jgi:uncharacterized protein YggE